MSEQDTGREAGNEAGDAKQKPSQEELVKNLEKSNAEVAELKRINKTVELRLKQLETGDDKGKTAEDIAGEDLEGLNVDELTEIADNLVMNPKGSAKKLKAAIEKLVDAKVKNAKIDPSNVEKKVMKNLTMQQQHDKAMAKEVEANPILTNLKELVSKEAFLAFEESGKTLTVEEAVKEGAKRVTKRLDGYVKKEKTEDKDGDDDEIPDGAISDIQNKGLNKNKTEKKREEPKSVKEWFLAEKARRIRSKSLN